MSKTIKDRIANLANKPTKKLKEIYNIYYYIGFFEEWIEYDLKTILIGRPDVLYEKSISITPFIRSWKDLRICIEYVFNYEYLCDKVDSRYDAYDLAQSLGINTCPYCNRNYTSTIITKDKEKFCRPAFDHYFAKTNHPLLAISFYNLIPSCTTCNSGRKGDVDVRLETHLHPYVDNLVDNIVFSYKYSTHTVSGLEVKIKSLSEKEENTLKLFGIKEIYDTHTNELQDMIRMRYYFTDNYLNILKSNLLAGIYMSKKELYRLAFGTELLSEDFINKPLSKFKRDILKELGIID
ncbi:MULTISPECIES: hypothetical protein [unclassified Dysgonomonas]|uniref:hypothetical protein n=1 Tax=unclassified Dysgonomonas TaxID=2630389 RepID=UPI0024770924|nr:MULTISPECIES: hypothetical protein [unclassified Dysgonomonas]